MINDIAEPIICIFLIYWVYDNMFIRTNFIQTIDYIFHFRNVLKLYSLEVVID